MSINVLFIPYSSTITGSKALRALNNTNFIQKELYKNTQTVMSQYCKLYDLAKKNEPYYDLIASQIAMTNQSIFDESFVYIPIDLIESGSNHNSFHPSQPDPLEFKMKSKLLNESFDSYSRAVLNEQFGYNCHTTEHIFIYGPITDIILQELLDKINTVITENTKLVIHFQGENILDEQGQDGDIIYGMESKGNLFKNSFNYQNSMKNSQIFRQFIQNSPNCESFTVICKQIPELFTYVVNDEVLKFPLNHEGVPIKNGLPKIYLTFYEHISYLLNSTLVNNGFYDKLNITKIYEDLVDKDNITSVLFMLTNTLDISKCYLYLIGREAFKLIYNNETIEHFQSMNFSLVPDKLKPCIEEFHKNIELDMRTTNECYWPAFKDKNYDLVYDKKLTETHYDLITECFKLCVTNCLVLYNIKYDNFIIDKYNLIANPSVNEQKLCLLNEILFYPSINAYLASINYIDNKYLNIVDEKLTNITKSNTYLSDIELSEIIDNKQKNK